MIQIETKVKLPFLWGKSAFKKNTWNQVNLIVGPNGSGKTLLAESLAEQFQNAGYTVEFLRSDRMEHTVSFERLKQDKTLRQRIALVLSNMFGKSMRFSEYAENEAVVPMVTNKARGIEYGLQDGECHGLKEIITLLSALYAGDAACLILDEPELHLHPQFQLFFMNEIRKTAESHPERLFFLITHSPFFIDLRRPEDLTGVVVCHINRKPTHIDSLSEDDAALFRRFLPRFNTYHKQFFFSDNQIFVEGYTDQQVFTYLLSCVETGPAGTGIIDVGGKDELGVFFKVCSLLGTNARIITDLDSLFCGKLCDMLCEDERPKMWLEKQAEKQSRFYQTLFTRRELKAAITLEKLIGKLEQLLSAIGVYLCDAEPTPKTARFSENLKMLAEKYEKPETTDTFKTAVLQGIWHLQEPLTALLPEPLAETLPLLVNLAAYILAAAETADVYILPAGCIENYYVQNTNEYMPIQGKDRLFHAELEYIISCSADGLKKSYPALTDILNRACTGITT